VRDARRLDGSDLLELHLRVPEVVEEASTVAEHHRNDVELKLDDEQIGTSTLRQEYQRMAGAIGMVRRDATRVRP
jgi:hypothetical protein